MQDQSVRLVQGHSHGQSAPSQKDQEEFLPLHIRGDISLLAQCKTHAWGSAAKSGT